MPATGNSQEPASRSSSGDALTANLTSLVAALVDKDEAAYESEFVHLLARVRELVERKLRMEGTKTDTRDFLGELLFTRLRRGMHLLLRSDQDLAAQRAAEWVMGVLFGVATLTEFAQAFDQALLRSDSGSKDFNFAGRTDFISVEEVLQMLAGGKHLGCLSLEKADNRLDIYLHEGRIWFLDPHHMIRRVLPGDSMQHRELPAAQVTAAENARAQTGQPVLLGLQEQGLFRRDELREWMRYFGKEVLFDFMRESEPYAFYYRKLTALPAFATSWDLRLGVTSLLLEGSKLVDDWKQMLQAYPNPDAAIEPSADMFARMGDVALSVLEIKLLSALDGDTTPRDLVARLGLPLQDIYQLLIKLCRDGILVPAGGSAALAGITLSLEESMQEAFAALDRNEDGAERQQAIDRVLGLADDAAAPASVLDRVLGGEEPPAKARAAEPDLRALLRRSPPGAHE